MHFGTPAVPTSQHVERVVELHRLELDALRVERLENRKRGPGARRRAEVVDHHALLHARQPLEHLARFLLRITPCRCEVAVGAEQDLGLISPSGRARPARRSRARPGPRRAEARRGEGAPPCLRHVGKIARDAVALLHPRLGERRDADTRSRAAAWRDGARWGPRPGRHRGIASRSRSRFGIVEPPFRSHFRRACAPGRSCAAGRARRTPDQISDNSQTAARLDPPAVQRLVARLAGELHEARELSSRRARGRRGPERLHCRINERILSGMRSGFCSASRNTTVAAPSAYNSSLNRQFVEGRDSSSRRARPRTP